MRDSKIYISKISLLFCLIVIIGLAGCSPDGNETDTVVEELLNDATTGDEEFITDTPQATINDEVANQTDEIIDNKLTLEEIMTPLDIDPWGATEWQNLPIIPTELSPRMQQLFIFGQAMGREQTKFSVVGDCHSNPVFFLAFYDLQADKRYFLGDEYAYLQDTINYYKGSFNDGIAAQGGQNVAAVFSPFWANAEVCDPTEGPIVCEIRRNNPVFALISLEENWNGDIEGYISGLEEVVVYTISQGVIPVLSTKASNLEGDHSINRAIVEIARQYELPVWNFWAAVKDLPGGGLEEDQFHLSLHSDYLYDFRDADKMSSGWGNRNLSALQFIDFMRNALDDVKQ